MAILRNEFSKILEDFFTMTEFTETIYSDDKRQIRAFLSVYSKASDLPYATVRDLFGLSSFQKYIKLY